MSSIHGNLYDMLLDQVHGNYRVLDAEVVRLGIGEGRGSES